MPRKTQKLTKAQAHQLELLTSKDLKIETPEHNPVSVIVGIDPSFSRTGICILDFKKKEINLFTASGGSKCKTFYETQIGITNIISRLTPIIEQADAVVMEEPFPRATFSYGLFGLDSSIFQTFKDKVIHTFNPMCLRKIHGGTYTKKQSVERMNGVSECLEQLGFTTISHTRKRGTGPVHDEAEACMYAVVTAIRLGLISDKNVRERLEELLHYRSDGICDWQPI